MNGVIRRRVMAKDKSILPKEYKQLKSVHKVLGVQTSFGSKISLPYTVITEVAPYLIIKGGQIGIMFLGIGAFFTIGYTAQGKAANEGNVMVSSDKVFTAKQRCTIKAEVKSSNCKYYVNNVDTGVTGNGGGYMNVGAQNAEGARGSEFDLFSFKVIKGGNTIKDLIPCKRKSDGRCGVYDIINNVFYGAAGAWTETT